VSEPVAEASTSQGTRYDRMAEGYARCWAPVIRPAAERVLDLADRDVAAGARRILDIGTGSGTLAIAAIERWPDVAVTGIDASAGMLEVARRHAGQRLSRESSRRFTTATAFADRLPYPDASFDLAVSSFVLQLVPSRAAALREARRVLNPGSTLAWVSWLLAEAHFAGDEVANAVLDEAGFDPPESDGRSGDPASIAAAAASMRRAGFRHVRAEEGLVEHPWDPAGYVAFLTEFDEETLFGELEAGERDEIVARMIERLSELSADEMILRLPVVYVTGRAI
jgi:ubiquinone/menaquinone biosynthesis C-methylase UbiE